MAKHMHIQRVGERFAAVVGRLVPDPFVLVLTLTFITLLVGFFFGGQVAQLPPGERLVVLADGWFTELYSVGLMRFAMQMCIVLVTGHALALSPPVQRVIAAVCAQAKGARSAVVCVVLVSCLASLIQWGLGVIVGAFMAREMGKRLREQGVPVHYPLLGAAGYSGFMVWHGGLSGSAPLKVAEQGHFLAASTGVIPITETIFSPLNVVVTGVTVAALVVIFWVMMPRDVSDMVEYAGEIEPQATGDDDVVSGLGWVARVERSAWFSRPMALLLGGWALMWFWREGLSGVNLNTINVLGLALGLLWHPSARSYVRAVQDGVKGCAGVILQFPFYFGVLGLLKSSGLIAQISTQMVAWSGPESFAVMTFLSAGFVNFLVPSGGGQWAVQGPLLVDGATQLGLEMPKVIMAMSYGDAWTNLLQPFWALPLLGIMGLEARDILGYTAVVLCVTGPLIMLCLWWL